MNHIALFRSFSPLAFALSTAAAGCVAPAAETQADPLTNGAPASDGPATESAAVEIASTMPPLDIQGDAKDKMADGAVATFSSTSTLVGLFTAFYIPPHVGGDAEYNGHGPNVSLQVQLYVFNGNELWASVYMDALETKSDWTRAQGTAWYRLYTASGPIAGIGSPTSFSHAYTDTDHAHDIFSFAPNYLVNKLDYVGDTDGKEAGTRTGVRVYFNPITIELE